MADAVTSQTIQNGERNLIIKLTNKSDGTGESAVTKVDVSTFSCDEVSIMGIQASLSGMEVELLWDADTDVSIMKLGDGPHVQDFTFAGGISNDAGTGKTGDIKLTTSNATSGDSYEIILYMRKKYA